MPEYVGTPNPSIKLPPAVLRLETIEFDPTGAPYYKLPPFLSPPDGVQLIPFDRFEARGIEVCLDTDVQELDGDGIPTVELGAKHGTGGDKEKKKKKRTKKEGDESKPSSHWWEDWAEGEDLRRTAGFDPNTPRTDRFAQGAADFQQNRLWTPAVQSLYDHFRQYSGLLVHVKKNVLASRADDDGVDDDDEEELLAAREREQQVENPASIARSLFDTGRQEAKIYEIDDETEAEQLAKEMRMDTFLNDPEESVKIFFSSFYKDKGLFWSQSRLRDGPILLTFFLGFFIRNRLMPDYEKVFRKAHKVAEQARIELPRSTKISMAIPDTFGAACTALWGSQVHISWGDTTFAVDQTTAAAAAADWQAELRQKGVEQLNFDTVRTESARWGTAVDGTQDGGGWGTPMVGDQVGGQDGGGWGSPSAASGAAAVDPWSSAGGTGSWGDEEPKPSLMSILGPTTFPLTHEVKLAEKSTRRVVSLFPPDPDEKGLRGILGSVLLAPWQNPKKDSTILPPELLTPLPESSTFDMGRDLIRVFVDPKTVDALLIGVGLHAICVQVGEIEGQNKEGKSKQSKSKSRGKSKAKPSDDREWWYMEFLYEVVPSFWTEPGE